MTYLLPLLALCLILCGCGDPTPRQGSAQSVAAGEQARTTTLEAASDNADVAAAVAQAKAAELEKIALQQNTKAAIDAAVKARVDAAVAVAVATALDKNVKEAQAAAAKAAKAAAEEKIKDEAAADARWWKRITEIAGASGLAIGVIVGGILLYVTKSWKVSTSVGGVIAAAGVSVGFYGVAAPWLFILLAASIVCGGLVWLVHHITHIHEGDVAKGDVTWAEAELAKAQAVVEKLTAEAKAAVAGKP